MSNQTLFLIQSQASETEWVFVQLNSMYSPSDAVVLMGDAALYCNSSVLSNKQVYVLETDTDLLIEPLPSAITVLSYDEFADLVLTFNRCISLK